MLYKLEPIVDSYVYQGFPEKNYGNSEYLYIGRYMGIYTTFRSILKFGLPTFISKFTINSAVIKLNCFRKDVSGNQSVKIYQYNANVDNDVTWNVSNAVDKNLIKEVTISETGEFIIDVMDIVKNWLNNPSLKQCLELRGVEDSDALVGFRSTNCSDENLRPVLEIDYSESSTTVESITSGNYHIDKACTTELGQKISTTFCIENNDKSKKGLAIAQISNNPMTATDMNWMDDKVAIVTPEQTKVLSTFGARKSDRVAILTTKDTNEYVFLDTSTTDSWSKNIKDNLLINTNEDNTTHDYDGQIPIIWEGTTTISNSKIDADGKIQIESTDVSVDSVSLEYKIKSQNIDLPEYYLGYNIEAVDLTATSTLDNLMLEDKIANVDGLVEASGIYVNPTMSRVEVEFMTDYSNFSSTSTDVKIDAYVEADKLVTGLKSNVYYKNNMMPDYILVASNVDLESKLVNDRIYISEISPAGLTPLGDVSDRTDYFKFEIWRESGTEQNYNLQRTVISGPEASDGLIYPNKEKILAKDTATNVGI